MKKVIIGLVALAAVASAAYWFFAIRATGTPPGAVGTLSAEHTAAAVGVQRLDSVAKQVLEGLKPLADKEPTIKKYLSPEARKGLLGFDPVTAAGWAEIGVDAATGLTASWDDRIKCGGAPGFVVLAGLSDRAKLLAVLESKLGMKFAFEKADGYERLALPGGGAALIGTRGPHTAIQICKGPGAAVDGFKAFLADTAKPLSADSAFKIGFREAEGGPTGFAYLNTQGAVSMAKALGAPKELVQALAHESTLFPGVATYVLEEGAGLRIVASKKGVEVLEKLFKPSKSAPKFSRYIPKSGWAAMRMSGNIPGFFDGAGALIPPEMAQAKAAISSAEMMMGLVAGFSMSDLAAAFTGHIVIGADTAKIQHLAGVGLPEVVVLLGVNKAAKADEIIPKIFKIVTGGMGPMGGAGPKLEALTIGGLAGKAVAVGPVTIVFVRDDDVMLIGPKSAVESALAARSGENFGSTAGAAAIDDDVVYGFAVDLGPLLKQFMAAPGMAGLVSSTPGLKAMQAQPVIAGSLRLDMHGLRVKQDAGSISTATGLIGVIAAVAIPAFVKYINHSKSTEAQLYLRRITDASRAYYQAERVSADGTMLPPSFPESAPLTPATSACERSTPRDGAPSNWTHPTWRALGMEIRDPHLYQYEYISDGKSFTARAIGDLDCDGVLSTFERRGEINASGEVVTSGPFRTRPLE